MASFRQCRWRRCVRGCLQGRLLESGWFLRSCAICQQHRLPSNSIANGRTFRQRCRKGLEMPHRQILTPSNMDGWWQEMCWKSCDYHKDKISPHQQYLTQWAATATNAARHNAHAAGVISLALRYVSAWVEQRVKIPWHADRFRVATAKIEWLVITSNLIQSYVI